ncbi:hypothetical protein A605_05710 [Corynebacterium halotolerans YIM 70093 = DSM 44683]|uniref:ABC-type glycine betaine transport system substrate-binding domain-containing protein n=1 Tax=Corynebacterium halotolerans YIM 70093 = DSM 44683 TaxID=1121362 RepID=M1NL70_9CORY|nr:hypothetical protein A605_05710 [Corynebacterium halotolerans YIM 70093 = DSM 44683]
MTISVNSSSIGQMVLGEMYQQVLAGEGRQTFLSLENAAAAGDRLARLNENKADLMVGCTGHMLYQLYPEKAREISEEYVARRDDPNAGDFSQLTYDEFVGALPGYLAVPDPSSAQGCSQADGTPELPQNIIPIYHKELFDREELKAITEAGRLLTTADLQEMAEEAERRGSVPEVVAEWVASQPI